MRFLSQLLLMLSMLIFLISCTRKNKADNLSINEVQNKSEIALQDSVIVMKARSLLSKAINNIKNEQFNDKTEELLDSARFNYTTLKHMPINDLNNLYSYYDVFTYRTNQLDKNIKYNKEFISLYKNYNNKNYQKLLMATTNLGYSLGDVGKPLDALQESVFPIKHTIDSLLKETIPDSLKLQLQVAKTVNYRQLMIYAQQLENGEILRASVDDFEAYLLEGNIPKQAEEFLPYALSNLADVCIDLGELEKAKNHISHWKSLIPPNKYIDQLMTIDLECKIQELNEEYDQLIKSFEKAKDVYNLIVDNNRYKNMFYSSIIYRAAKIELKNKNFDHELLDDRIKQLMEMSISDVRKDQIFALYAYDLEVKKRFLTNNLDSIPYYLDIHLELANKFQRSDFLNKYALSSVKYALLRNDSRDLDITINNYLERIKIKSLDEIGVSDIVNNHLYGSLHTAQTLIELSNLILENAKLSNNQSLYHKSFKLALLSGLLVNENNSQFNYNVFEKNLIDNINTNLLLCRLLLKVDNVENKMLNDNIVNVVEQNTNSQLTIKNRINNIKYSYHESVKKVLDNLNLLDVRIAQLKSQLIENDDKDKNLTEELDSLKLNKSNLLLSLKKQSYGSKINEALDFNLFELKSNLSKQEVIVRFYDYDNLYVFLISKNDTQFFNLGSSEDLSQKVFNFLSDVKQLENYENSYNEISSNLKFLNKNLSFEKVTVVPEGSVSLLPFELFLDKNLESDRVVNYNTSLKLIGNINKDSNELLASYSPAYLDKSDSRNEFQRSIERNNNAYQLPFAQEEAAYVASLFDGDLYNDTTANKGNFISTVSNYGVLHLAMHAYVDEDNEYNSMLLFSSSENEDHLDLNTIYNLKLNADLTTLSACNTGFGRVDSEEGVLSFSRAFQYAGSDATLTSLWRVPDKETSIIMKRFYDYLKEGLSKSEALKNAKQDYLKNIDDPNLKHPYYWAGFVLTGDTSAIVSSTNYWLYGVVFFVLILIVFIIAKRRLIPKS
ncbi:CHAT domain-containing protein [Winogradskyella psychrotolerans]|uniref:CHAT domain-containing protein n=1 Tax=Winogradskyella psychrotolerans TaxID=1344585 RepID=UPI001C073A58|nr:CHAT domain-containing protein [Winogradskyella psychrotolerans]MBU2927949.1 CHAT domain-containing protein [Winogradskyella psychrotolerans]